MGILDRLRKNSGTLDTIGSLQEQLKAAQTDLENIKTFGEFDRVATSDDTAEKNAQARVAGLEAKLKALGTSNKEGKPSSRES